MATSSAAAARVTINLLTNILFPPRFIYYEDLEQSPSLTTYTRLVPTILSLLR
jgi:hypothetical protein